MNLQAINQQLQEVSDELFAKVKEFQKADHVYNLRFYDLILHSGLGNAQAREAEANLVCQEEGILEPVQILRADVRALYHRKDCLIEIARNLRATMGREERATEYKGDL